MNHMGAFIHRFGQMPYEYNHHKNNTLLCSLYHTTFRPASDDLKLLLTSENKVNGNLYNTLAGSSYTKNSIQQKD